MSVRPRVILVLPNANECTAIADWLAADGFEPVRRSSPRAVADEAQAGRAADLLVVDASVPSRTALITSPREGHPRAPTIVIGDAASDAPSALGDRHAMHLTRPVDRATFLCTVSMAILEGRQVRRSARKVVNRFDAIVNNAPAHIIDVSKEGLRLEIRRDRRTPPPPPYFRVGLPLIGTAVAVQRMWARATPGDGRTEAVTLCGVALSQNRTGAEQAWQVFVDTIAVAGNASLSSH